MTGTNHALTGGVIGLAIGGPLAIPVAFASHFVLDALPHFGADSDDRIKNRKTFLRIIAVDAFLLVGGLIIAILLSVPWYVYVSALAAMSPDFVWMYRYVFEEKMGKLKPGPKNTFNQMHADIQTMETPSGIWFELVWFISMFIVAVKLI